MADQQHNHKTSATGSEEEHCSFQVQIDDTVSREEHNLLEQNKPSTEDGSAKPAWSRRDIIKAQLRHLLILVIIDIGLPLAIFYVFRIFTSDIVALICSGVPPILRVAYVLIRYRRIDVLSCIFVLAFVVSGALSAVTGDVRVVLLRESFVTLIIGVLFVVTLIPLRTRWFQLYPMTFLVSREMFSESPDVTWTERTGEPQSMKRSDWLYMAVKPYRRFHLALTAAWGFGLLLEFAIKAILIFTGVPTANIVLFGNISFLVIAVLLFTGSTVAILRMRKRLSQCEADWHKANNFAYKFDNASANEHQHQTV